MRTSTGTRRATASMIFRATTARTQSGRSSGCRRQIGWTMVVIGRPPRGWVGRGRMGSRLSHSRIPCQRMSRLTRWVMNRCRAVVCDQGAGRGRNRRAGRGRREHALAVAVERHGDAHPVGREVQADVVPPGHVVERRDVEGLVDSRPAGPVDVEQVGVPLAVGVVHLEDDSLDLAVWAEAPEHRQRVEGVAEDPGVGQHEHPVARVHQDAAAGEEPLDVAPDAAPESTPVQVVTRVEPGQRPRGPGEMRERVEVDQPLELPVHERALQGGAADVADRADHQRGERRSDDGGHQRTPKDSAASTPERQPSSWNPHPRWAPAKASLGPPAARNRAAAATASWVKTGCA